ncbi:hypothetical protein C8N35_101153 [Breoghania corrubedonensis]|uniref:Uncharacterized protein n=1 Tax=Breoghania corrubedonensis TaxID=665038 RepID=A0A2T5VED4_9HYPH|nr:hypothetical protein [Breoghania corrubedonensis]PTW62118.1 hypothetical protein C8N35_101153 [Breoghania corrubedonensis]
MDDWWAKCEHAGSPDGQEDRPEGGSDDRPLSPHASRAGLGGWIGEAEADASRRALAQVERRLELVDLLHRRGTGMLGFVVATMASCILAVFVSIWLGFGAVEAVLACWLTANLVFILVAARCVQNFPLRR